MTEVFAQLSHFKVCAQCVKSDLVKPIVIKIFSFLACYSRFSPGRILTPAGLNNPSQSKPVVNIIWNNKTSFE